MVKTDGRNPGQKRAMKRENRQRGQSEDAESSGCREVKPWGGGENGSGKATGREHIEVN